MLITVFSPKGGSGTSTCAALLAKSCSMILAKQTVLIDAANGDIETIVGFNSESKYGFIQWLESATPTSHSLEKISNFIEDNFSYVSYSSIKENCYIDKCVQSDGNNKFKIQEIISTLSTSESNYIIDIGTNINELNNALIESSDFVFMVLRGCYITLSRATKHPYLEQSDVAIYIAESGRSITAKQMGTVLKLKCIIEIEARRDFAKVIDAGVLLFRTPKYMISAIDKFMHDVNKYFETMLTNFNDQNVSKAKNKNYNRIQSLSNDTFDIFNDAEEHNNRNFWDVLETESRNRDGVDIISEKSLNTKNKIQTIAINDSYTSHLHDVFDGIKDKGRS